MSFRVAGLVGSAALLSSTVFAHSEKKGFAHCGGNDNSAFVFIKPHANTRAAQAYVKRGLEAKGLKIQKEGEITGETIDKDMLIDQHYYAIASKATLVKANKMPVDPKKFEAHFGVSWDSVVSAGKAYNALDACSFLGIDASALDAAWAKAKKANKLVKLGGGFYCGLIDTIPGKAPIYVFNGFFMSMRSKFVQPGTSIHYYVVDWSSDDLKWADFRGKVLGPTDPAEAPAGSLRAGIYSDWSKLGLKALPDTGDNGVHASASPFEGLAEKMNWLKVSPEADDFGKKLLKAGISKETIGKWSVDPQVKGKSIFDQLEDMDSTECIQKAASLNK